MWHLTLADRDGVVLSTMELSEGCEDEVRVTANGDLC
jgi:hypothetical protein